MVHGILQFTPSIAFRYVLHRCESRDIRCRESFVFKEQRASPRTIRERGARGGLPILVFLGAFRAGVRWPPKRARKRASRRGREGASAPKCLKRVRGSFCSAGFDNDPSAGSPTETLLRLLLPLDSQVRPSSQHSARAVGRPRRGRSEGLTKPSNR